MRIPFLIPNRASLLSVILITGLTGCQSGFVGSSTPTDPNLIMAAQNTNSKIFSSQMATFVPSTNSEKSISKVISDTIIKGFNAGDGQKMSMGLSSDFQRRFIVSDDQMGVEDRSSVIENANKNAHANVQLTYAIQSMKLADDGKSAAVVALATYQSKHFSPRYMESLVFMNVGDAWKLSQQSMFILHPTVPEMHNVQILVAEKFWPDSEGKTFSDVYAKMAESIGPDAAIDYFISNVKPRTGDAVHVIAVFREPPNVGTRVTMNGRFELEGNISKFSKSSIVNAIYRNYIFEIKTAPIPPEQIINFDILVNGLAIGKNSS